MALNQCPIKVQKTKNSETILSKSQPKIMSRKNVFRNNFGGERGGQPRPCTFTSQKWLHTLELNKT